MNWDNLSDDDKKYLRKMIKLGEKAGKTLKKFADGINKDNEKNLKILERLKELSDDRDHRK